MHTVVICVVAFGDDIGEPAINCGYLEISVCSNQLYLMNDQMQRYIERISKEEPQRAVK